MSDFKTLADKFWLRMGEKFGKRWIDERGTAPNDEWRALINRYTEYQISLALDDLPKWAHPPTHPEMAAHLRSFSARDMQKTPADYARDYWRSCIVAEIEHQGWLRGYWRRNTSLLNLVEPMRANALRAIQSLVEEMCRAEMQVGDRAPGLLRKAVSDCAHIVSMLAISSEPDRRTGEKSDAKI